MSLQPITDLGSHTVAVFANCQQDASADPVLLTAAATEDGVKVTGGSIIRRDAMACVLSIAGKAKLTEAKTIAFAVEYQDSADGSTWNTAVAMQASTVAATGGTGGSTEEFYVDLPLALKARARYIRFNITPDMSATGTDIAVWGAVCHLGGFNQLPATLRTS